MKSKCSYCINFLFGFNVYVKNKNLLFYFNIILSNISNRNCDVKKFKEKLIWSIYLLMIISSDKFFELCSISLYILDFLLTDICPWVWTGTWGLVAYRESEQWFVLSRWCLSNIRDTLQKLTCIWKYIWR